jgi:hypothetical protein
LYPTENHISHCQSWTSNQLVGGALPIHAFASGRATIQDVPGQTLTLQLFFLRTSSESMGNHDSKIVDAGSVD